MRWTSHYARHPCGFEARRDQDESHTLTGSRDAVSLSSAPPGAPLYSYLKNTYANADTGDAQPYFTIWGTLEELDVDVTSPYTGPLPSTMTPNTLFAEYFDTPNTFVSFTPAVIQLKSAGSRTLTNVGYPSNWKGAKSGDTLTMLSQAQWASTAWRTTSDDIRSDPSHPMSVTVEVISRQNVVAGP